MPQPGVQGVQPAYPGAAARPPPPQYRQQPHQPTGAGMHPFGAAPQSTRRWPSLS
eukprot:gene7567-17914_t